MRKNKHIWLCLLNWTAILVVYLLVFLGTVNSWSHKDYLITQHMTNLLKNGQMSDKPQNNPERVQLDRIRKIKDLVIYFGNTFSYMFHTLKWYNGKPLVEGEDDISKDTGWAVDYTNRIIGVIRLRIKLGKKEDCIPMILKKRFPLLQCVQPLTDDNEEKGNYSIGWRRAMYSYSDKTLNQWKYQSSTKFQTLIKYGLSGSHYSSGGYFLDLSRNAFDTNTILTKSSEAGWFSNKVQVIFIDMCLYSPNTKKISLVSACLELRGSTRIDTRFRVIHLPTDSNFSTWDVLLSLLLVIVILSLTFYLYVLISEAGTQLFSSFWDILDVFIVPLFVLNYIFSMKFKIYLKFNIEHDLRSGQDKFFYFGWLEYYTYTYYCLFIILFVLCSIKLLKYCTDTLQVLPIVMTIRSAWNLIFKIMLFVAPFIYIKFKVIDCFLFNSQMASNRFPLVNKVGLKNYSKHYVFPEDKLVPYLTCQLCSVIIGLISAFIVHHYRITKNSSLLASNSTDLLFELKEWIRKGKKMKQIRKLKDTIKPMYRRRLRSGADCFDPSQAVPQVASIEQSLFRNLNTQTPIDYEESYKMTDDDMEYLNILKRKETNKYMNGVLKSIDEKLDKILKNLMDIMID